MAETKLNNLLEKNTAGPLKKLVQTAQNVQSLTTRLQSVVAPEAAPHLVSGVVRDSGELVVVCTSSAWASRIRFDADALVEAARGEGHAVTRCRVTVGA